VLEAILIPALLLGGMGVLFGLGLGLASVKFKVTEDPRLSSIRGALPGANCGGCGYAGCDLFAAAVLSGGAQPGGCPVGGEKTARDIAGVLGVSVCAVEQKKAFVRCLGSDGKCGARYEYYGLRDCKSAAQMAGGGFKNCTYGCLGAGSCQSVCKFGAISISGGIASVDPERCTGCGVCVASCPKNLIAMIPYMNGIHVGCRSKDPSRDVRRICRAGCIGCRLCEKACAYGAVHVRNNLAAIDYGKCVQCGACVAKCPVKCITDEKR